MKAAPAPAPGPTVAAPPQRDAVTAESELDRIGRNIAAVEEFYLREERKLSRSQRIVERISTFVGRPAFLALILAFVTAWVGVIEILRWAGRPVPDPAPYFWLQGIIGLCSLLTATVVLAKQNRMARLEEQRAHLDLKVTLLTEQKAAKLIDLLEELRRDLPNVKDRHDVDAAELGNAMNPDLVLAALDEVKQPHDGSKPPPGAAPTAGGA